MVILTGQKLFDHNFCQEWLKFYDKMHLPIRMRIPYNVKNCHVIRSKFGGTFFTSLAKLVLEGETGIFSIVASFRHFRSSPPKGGLIKRYKEVFWKYAELRLWHGCSPLNLQHIFRTPFSKNTPGGLLLAFVIVVIIYNKLCITKKYRLS